MSDKDTGRSTLQKILHPLFGIYAWLVFLACVTVAIACVLLLPGLQRRRRAVAAAARAIFLLTGIRSQVNGLQTLPEGHSIVVANHASYVDGVILQAYLPPRFSYVIKGEVRNVPVVHFLLRRIGAHFVERFVTSASARDARNLLQAAANGESLAFFPEGTFIAKPGLGRFRAGAFAAAISGSLPIVPVVIRGSRQILTARTLLPRPGRLQLDILECIPPQHPDFVSSARLAATARRKILALLDEPDLLAADER
ncbi:MAG: hypothetical protein BMS9Abin32_231 [Gammaproteobacteria bacterium]|nr:MAG: hypothetical protein BMS9Abin32_231 [Gammaproteobacteria bacterium]